MHKFVHHLSMEGVMSSKKKLPQNLTGRAFIDLVHDEIRYINQGVTKTSLATISRAAGYNKWWLGRLADAANPNPTVLGIRSVLFVLGYDVPNPEQDVIPHLKKKNVYRTEYDDRISS